MADHPYTVRADWDEEAATWVAEGEDVPGLVTGADTFEALIEKLRVMVPEMLEFNGVLSAEEAANNTPPKRGRGILHRMGPLAFYAYKLTGANGHGRTP